MMISQTCNQLFDDCIARYHQTDDVDADRPTAYEPGSFEALLYHKCWIDTVQWHLEDIIRHPEIVPEKALHIKRRIDASNQERTDMVEFIDAWFLQQFKNVKPLEGAGINTESPAWAIDRLCILALKIYHMQAETLRQDATAQHIAQCAAKLMVLQEQRKDLSLAIDALLTEIGTGHKYMKVYKQMKMYNDPTLNPVLYQQKA
jgi:Protein of unknown function (DUF4254)